MSFDRNKATEYMIKINKILPAIVTLIIVCWILPPILMFLGGLTKIPIFHVLAVLVGFLSTILFWGLIIFAFARVIITVNGQQNETPTQNVQQNEYTPQLNQEPEYTTVFREAENYETPSLEEQKQFEREMFAMQHPILSVFRNKIIPFIWILAVLCIIVAAVIFFLDYVYGIKLHF